MTKNLASGSPVPDSNALINKMRTSGLTQVAILEHGTIRRCERKTLSFSPAVFRFLSCSSVLWVFLVAASILPVAAELVQTGPPGYTSDNSDWWSYTRRPEADDEAISQKRELPASNFQILGFKLNDETFGKATAKLGKATVVERGDASTGRSQICYASPGRQSKTYLIFEKGEVNDAFYLLNVGPDWKGSELCTESNLVTANLSTASGLHLGQTSAQVRAILGKPSVVADDKIIYSLGVEKKTSAADFENLKQRNPQLSQGELHRDYESYTLGVYIETRFLSGKLVYLAISKTEGY
jgi:hypothetical protein